MGTIDIPDIQRALYADYIASDNVYKKDVKKMITGLGMDYHENIPIFKHFRDMKPLASKKAYRAKADKTMHNYQIVPDAPNFKTAKKADIQASDVKYKSDALDIRSKTKGYQVLKAQERGDVRNALRADAILSINKYKEEYDRLRDLVYFPFDLTGQYDAMAQTMENQSDSKYAKEAKDEMHIMEYKITDSGEYQVAQKLRDTIGRIAYLEEHLADLKHSPFVTDTPWRAVQRKNIKQYSDNTYRKSAKDVMNKYDLITDETRMKQAFRAAEIFSDRLYKEEYNSNLLGFGADGLYETPTMQSHVRAGILQSNLPYQEEAKRTRQYVTYKKDAVAIQHAKHVNPLSSQTIYKQEAKKLTGKAAYNTLLLKDNYLLKKFYSIKDQNSESKYKDDMFFMRGHLHPVPDTPFNLNALAQTNRQSDNVYKADLKTEIQGYGVTDVDAVQFEHQRKMKTVHDETAYRREVLCELPFWESDEAGNTPFALKAREANILTSKNKYKEQYEQEKGKGCTEYTPFMLKAQEANEVSYLFTQLIISCYAHNKYFTHNSWLVRTYTRRNTSKTWKFPLNTVTSTRPPRSRKLRKPTSMPVSTTTKTNRKLARSECTRTRPIRGWKL